MSSRKKLTQDEIIDLYEEFLENINNLKNEDFKNKLNKLINDYGVQLLNAPASTRDDFHCAYAGGLLEHSLCVYKTFKSLENTFISLGGKPTWTEDEMIIATLFHDLGKAGEPSLPYYVSLNSKWHNDKGIYYEKNKDLTYMEHEERSIFMLQKYGISLTKVLWEAILLHQGPFTEFNQKHFSNFETHNVPIFAIILHQADWMSSIIEKQKADLL